MSKLDSAIRMKISGQIDTFVFKNGGHSIQQFVEAYADGSLFKSIQLFVEIHSLVRKFPRVSKDFLDVVEHVRVLDPDHGTCAVTRLYGGTSDRKRIGGRGRQLRSWPESSQVSQPRNGEISGLE